MWVLLAPIAAIVLIGLSQSGGNINFGRDGQGALQFIVPMCLTVTLQWYLLRYYLRWRS